MPKMIPLESVERYLRFRSQNMTTVEASKRCGFSHATGSKLNKEHALTIDQLRSDKLSELITLNQSGLLTRALSRIQFELDQRDFSAESTKTLLDCQIKALRGALTLARLEEEQGPNEIDAMFEHLKSLNKGREAAQKTT